MEAVVEISRFTYPNPKSCKRKFPQPSTDILDNQLLNLSSEIQNKENDKNNIEQRRKQDTDASDIKDI